MYRALRSGFEGVQEVEDCLERQGMRSWTCGIWAVFTYKKTGETSDLKLFVRFDDGYFS